MGKNVFCVLRGPWAAAAAVAAGRVGDWRMNDSLVDLA